MFSDDVKAWMKRLNRKGPFYLIRTEPFDNSVVRPDGEVLTRIGNNYFVIWNDKEKTKIGCLSDHMYCRYGISTIATLNGDRPHDLWNGSAVSNADFDEMLKVRKGNSSLPTFDLTVLKNISH